MCASKSLQFATYIFTSIITFWIYDYACSLHEEWTFLLRSHWSKMKGLYIVTRYLPFILLATNLYRSFTPNEASSRCRELDDISSGLCIILDIFSECISHSPVLCVCVSHSIHPVFFILRTHVLWNKNRILLATMLTTFFTILIASFAIAFATTAPAAYTTSTIPGITGCYQSSNNFWYFMPYLLLSMFQLGLMILTLIRAIQNWRKNSSRLFVVLMNHNLSYYACGLLFSVMNIFTSLFLQYSYHSVLYVL
ncbi:uncharacterized protein EDB93DRAFT_696791 [Suillus bovinus]|uniref:uncharacterized protein n=1 Tax=Suillus bovinus TaxID=48563 RepID=UPI001B874E11|nr:uncharacterized protein EDB93DRAFT_696791 [Suillus bovinus]KAG2139590.1 hypothetical protein EDB93DRAFT_696791 [Suillus bovinus]